MLTLLEKIHLVIVITKVKMERGGLFIAVRLMPQKYQMNGIHGFTSPKIKLKTNTI